MGDTQIIPPFEKGNPDTISRHDCSQEKNFHTTGTQHLEGELLPIGKGGALRFHITNRAHS